MTDADLELRLRQWLAADAAAMHAPDALQRRVLDIPATSAGRAWWHRFAGIPAVSASLATAAVAGVLIATMFFGLFDRPAGSDGELCSNRQVQQALDNLRDAPGYRYLNSVQTRQLDPDAGLDFDDPRYVWTDGSTAEGAYLAPDRVIERVTSTRGGLFDRGYLEHVQIAGHTYRLSEIDGVETWVEDTNWPTANLVYGYIGAAFPTFSVPLVSGADWGGTPVPAELPGTNGCTAATAIPLRDDEVGFLPQRAVALRIDVRTLHPTAVLIGPAAGEAPREGEERSSWQITWETPDPSEIVEPVGALPDPNSVEQSFVPTPSPSLPEPAADAWPAIELPADAGGANVSDVVAGDGRLVAIGAGFEDGHAQAAIWTSTDGATWEPAVDTPDGAGLGLYSIEWNGSTYLATGLRDEVTAEGEYVAARPEAWLSDDGLSWRLGGTIGPEADTGEVGNPSRPVSTASRWVAGGSVWNLAENQQRPAFFVSPDGEAWETIELDDVGSGSLGTVVVMPDGSLLATGCESPGETNSGQFGEACYTRLWRSADGFEWTPGPIGDTYIGAMVRWGDGLIGIVSESDPTGQSEGASRLATSLDGVTWAEVDSFAPGDWSPNAIEVFGSELVILGQTVVNDSVILGTASRSPDGATWETIELGFPDGTDGVFLGGAVETPSGLAILGGSLDGADNVPLLWLEPAGD